MMLSFLRRHSSLRLPSLVSARRLLSGRANHPIPTRAVSGKEIGKSIPAFGALGERLVGSFDILSLNVHEDAPKDRARPFIHESWFELIVPFSQNLELREKYALFNTTGFRFGKVLEIIDALAADAAWRYAIASANVDKNHPETDSSQVSITTASLEHMKFERTMDVTHDLHIVAYVAWVGKTSMEVEVQLKQLGQVYARATFVLATRHRKTWKGVPVLQPEFATEFERERFSLGEKRKQERAMRLATTLSPPTVGETELIHSMLTQRRQNKLDGQFVEMHDAEMSNVLLMHKQDRNVNNQMFGGHLMRVALETAWANTYRFTKMSPTLNAIDQINFFKAVEIGSIVELHSAVTYVVPEKRLALCGVTLQMYDPSTRTSQLTNDMQFVFKIEGTGELPKVIPHSYEEVLRYLAARRRMEGENDVIFDDCLA